MRTGPESAQPAQGPRGAGAQPLGPRSAPTRRAPPSSCSARPSARPRLPRPPLGSRASWPLPRAPRRPGPRPRVPHSAAAARERLPKPRRPPGPSRRGAGGPCPEPGAQNRSGLGADRPTSVRSQVRAAPGRGWGGGGARFVMNGERGAGEARGDRVLPWEEDVGAFP